MKTLADLKRAIRPGVRLRCIANTYRPELNGRERVVCRVQTNAFTWTEPVDHTLIVRSLRDADASCSCGLWHIVFPTFDADKAQTIRGRIEDDFAGHRHRAAREMWTRFEKASAYTFDGDTFTFPLAGDEKHSVTLQLLGEAQPCP